MFVLFNTFLGIKPHPQLNQYTNDTQTVPCLCVVAWISHPSTCDMEPGGS